MELQLGLGLPYENDTMKGLDLNGHVSEPKGFMGSGQLQSAGPCSWFSRGGSSTQPMIHSFGDDNHDDISACRKRNFSDAFEDSSGNDEMPRTLPLLVWNNDHPNKEDDDPPRDLGNNNNSSSSPFASDISDGESDGLVGWPPVKVKKKKHCLHNRAGKNIGCAECQTRPPSKSMFIKVQMEGVGIARKIDVSLYHSLSTLKETLLAMFGICQENSSSYRLTYQDREGDWLLAEDVSWRNFTGSVQRLKLMRSSS